MDKVYKEAIRKNLLAYKIKQQERHKIKLLELNKELKYLKNVHDNIKDFFLDNYEEEKNVLKTDIQHIEKEILFIKKYLLNK
jgi:hypothetical protein